jgi:hypothetical protein
MDAISVITLISAGLKLVDMFREVALRFRGQSPSPPGARAEQSGNALEIKHGNNVTQKITARQIKMDQWDSARYKALNKRIQKNWSIYNDLFASEVDAAVRKRSQIKAEMRKIQTTLCQDFKEMVALYERALGTSLPDHYQLYEVCRNSG